MKATMLTGDKREIARMEEVYRKQHEESKEEED